MASIFPFRAWRPHSNKVKRISCPPYDVVDTEEARNLAENNPDSFLHVIRPEIDLPVATAFNDKNVYKKGAENLQRFIDEGLLMQEDQTGLYIYQIHWKRNVQAGLFGCVSVEEYDNKIILKHELTRPDKEDDRTKHILTQQAHAEPVMLTYRSQKDVEILQNKITTSKQPIFDFKAPDGVRHKLWKIDNAEPFIEAFEKIEHLYIADGHHRCKSASRAAHELHNDSEEISSEEAFNYFPAVIFPSSEMHILPYNRLIHQLTDNFIEKLHKRFEVTERASPSPKKKGDISLYLNNRWVGIKLPQTKNENSVEKLDVYRLQEFLLEPLLNITDQRTDENISFVGGSRGTKELERYVDAGKAELAISMYPTAIEELIEVSDEGGLMPPKSTWFEPKLRSGLLVHTF